MAIIGHVFYGEPPLVPDGFYTYLIRVGTVSFVGGTFLANSSLISTQNNVVAVLSSEINYDSDSFTVNSSSALNVDGTTINGGPISGIHYEQTGTFNVQNSPASIDFTITVEGVDISNFTGSSGQTSRVSITLFDNFGSNVIYDENVTIRLIDFPELATLSGSYVFIP